MNKRFNKIFFCIFLKSCRPRAMFQKWKNGPTNWRDFIRMIQKKVFMRLESHRSIVLPYILLSQWRYSLGRRIFLAWSSTTSMYVYVCMYSPYHCEPTLYGCQSQLCQPGRTAKILAPHKHQDHWNRSAAFVLLHYLYIETLWVVVVGWFGSGCFGISVSIIE